jgi:hypothetical protein
LLESKEKKEFIILKVILDYVNEYEADDERQSEVKMRNQLNFI